MRGFDPKWSDVVISTRFSGAVGQTITCNDKTNERFTAYNCEISAHPDFVGGAMRFTASGTAKLVLSTSNYAYLADNLFEIDFVLESLGVAGLRGLFRDGLRCVTCMFDATTSELQFGIRSSSSAPWSMLSYQITDLDAFVGVRHSLRCVMTASDLTMELDGEVVGTMAHGVTSMAAGLGNFAIGNASFAVEDSFIGWIGQFRWTRALRPDEMGLVMPDRFPILSALDPNREKVVLHSHFDGANNATAATDTTGASLVFSGGAVLKDTDARFGVSSLSLNSGAVHCDGIDFSAQRFTIEFFEKRTENDGVNRYLVSIMDEAGVDHALSVAAPYFGPVTLRKNGVDVSTSASGSIGPTTTWQHWAIVRDGEYVAVFVGGQRSLLVNIGVNPLLSNGRFVLGKGGSVAPAAVSKDWVDECRITIDVAHYNVLSTSIVPPPERFNEYGPRALSGTVRNPDGTPRPNTLVRCYHLASGRLVSQGYSDVDGTFALPTADSSLHFWTAHHPTNNALIRDRITPALIGS